MAERLDVFQFGRQLIETGDLDPTYIVLWESQLEEELRGRFLLAYFCFYHYGTAAWISSQGDYWEALLGAASTKEHPRSSERRHFRGQAAIDAVLALRGRCLSPAKLVARLGHRGETPTLSTVMGRVKKHRGFGDWIGFKVADMLERLDLCPVQFKPEDVFEMYEAPRKGAELVAEQMGYTGEDPYGFAYNTILEQLGDLQAPPRRERRINIQEIETILCKYKSHWNGHYGVGKDIIEVRHGLLRYAKCKLAQRLLRAGKSGQLW